MTDNAKKFRLVTIHYAHRLLSSTGRDRLEAQLEAAGAEQNDEFALGDYLAAKATMELARNQLKMRGEGVAEMADEIYAVEIEPEVKRVIRFADTLRESLAKTDKENDPNVH